MMSPWKELPESMPHSLLCVANKRNERRHTVTCEQEIRWKLQGISKRDQLVMGGQCATTP
jgi:hypothetical protein